MGEEELRVLLVRENELRLSEETQRAYEAAERSTATDWIEHTDSLQRRVLREHGVPPAGEAAALRALRAATDTYPSLASLALYVRHNRARAGSLAAGEAVPDVPLTTLDGAPTTLLAHAGGPLPVLLVAGSLS